MRERKKRKMPQYQDKKTKLWKYRVYLIDEFGRKKQKEKRGFKTKKEAKLAEEKLVQENEKRIQDREKLKNCISFSQLTKEYLEYKHLKLKINAYKTIESRIRVHITPYFEKFENIHDILPADYINWQIEIDKKVKSFNYKSSLHTAFVNLLNYAMDFHGLKENVASKIKNFSNKTSHSQNINYWDYEEYQNFINGVDDALYHLLFEVLYFTGLRIGECLALTWNDLQQDYLNINKTLTRVYEDNKKILNSPKTTSSNRQVKLDPITLQHLLEYKEKQKKKIHFKNDWFIFGDLKSLSTTTIDRKKNYYCEKTHTKKIRIHDFRHSHVSLLISNGVPITVIQKRLGHSNSSITLKIYAHMLKQDEDKAIYTINRIRAS